jgi:hypothetical protein
MDARAVGQIEHFSANRLIASSADRRVLRLGVPTAPCFYDFAKRQALGYIVSIAGFVLPERGRQQRSRIQDIEQTLQLALLEVQLELRRAAAQS